MVIYQQTFDEVLAMGCESRKGPAKYGHIREFTFNGVTVKDAGIKVRGNTSRCNEKRQFKIKFNLTKAFSIFNNQTEIKEFGNSYKSRRMYGQKTISLRASKNDPSQLRERISSEIFNQAYQINKSSKRGGLVYRVGFGQTFLSNGRLKDEGPADGYKHSLSNSGLLWDYKGFYSIAETIDDVFLFSRFEGDKNFGRSTLIQADKGAARFTRAGYRSAPQGFDHKLYAGVDPQDDASDLKDSHELLENLFDKLEKAKDERDLEKFLDTDSFASYLAGVMLTGHWDSLVANRNNDYLYFNHKTEKWHMITWDLDNSLGVIYHEYKNYLKNDIFAPRKRGSQVLLYAKLLDASNSKFRKKLQKTYEALFAGFYSDENIREFVQNLQRRANEATAEWEKVRTWTVDDIIRFTEYHRREIKRQL